MLSLVAVSLHVRLLFYPRLPIGFPVYHLLCCFARSYWQSWTPGEIHHLLHREWQTTAAQVGRYMTLMKTYLALKIWCVLVVFVCVAEDSLYCCIWGSNSKFQFRQGAIRYYTELCNNLSSDYFIFKPWNSLWVTATPTMLFIIHLFVWHRVFCDMFYDY